MQYASDQEMIRENVKRLCASFDDEYWLARDTDGQFPDEFCEAVMEWTHPSDRASWPVPERG